MKFGDIATLITDVCFALFSLYKMVLGSATAIDHITFHGTLIFGGIYIIYLLDKKRRS